MIDKEKAIKGLKCCGSKGMSACASEKCPYYPDKYEWDECTSQLANDALELLKEQKLATDINVPNKWISVKDRLPDEDNSYLVNVKLPYGRDPWYVCISTYRHVHPDKFGCFGIEKVGFTHGGVVTHWMPLPEPKKE